MLILLLIPILIQGQNKPHRVNWHGLYWLVYESTRALPVKLNNLKLAIGKGPSLNASQKYRQD